MAKGLWPVINVESVTKSVEFYKGIGLKAYEETMEGMGDATFGTVEVGESGIIIWSKHNMPPDQPADTKAWLSGELGKGVMFNVGVPNAKKAWEKAQALCAEVETPYEAQPWGGGAFTLVDPDGYVVGITDKFPEMSTPVKKKAATRKTARKAPRKAAKKAGKGKRR